ncbi:protein phosphatase regulatory subunit [Moniliophthora roreri MCA 2997]|uniref:Protein phosphatase regulatory subunit n=2 Tax=Moniliophthora roreri TaxID=221103 RepID=V2YKK8_MONRO|nr:protein phosphatase regulatory subunit [Moniliophthora roreri MCA 2997]
MSTISTPVFDPIDVPASRHSDSNTAGAPLPIIPRRGGSSSRLNTLVANASTSPKFTPSPVQITLQQATPPDDDTASSSSSLSTTGTSHRRSSSSSDPSRLSPTSPTRPLLKLFPTPSEPVTPTPAFRNARSKEEGHATFPSVSGSSSSSDEASDSRGETTDDITPRPSLSSTMPLAKRTTEASFPRTLSESHVYHPGLLSHSHSKATSKPPETPIVPIIIRKKSGQPVKSSLKSSCRSPFTGTINVSLGGVSSKSEPTTPTVPKAVKFDARLEHVKLFLAEQKPLAVSRDGSPTDETSGTDSDFPDFIYGSDDKKNLTMKVVNMPSIVNMNADVVLEEMKFLSETTTVIGRIRVRNLAYQKWVAVRFTFDDWQTTSEVTAKYVESASGNIDIFTFTIKLNDLLARIEKKTMIVAVRYAVNGTEIWDNNLGKNYLVNFSRETSKATPPTARARRRNPSEDSYSSGSDISDLRTRLEQVVQKREFEEDNTPMLRAHRGQNTKNLPPNFKKAESFAARYDFGSSFKESWAPPSVSSIPHYATYRHARIHSYPALSSKDRTPERPAMKVKPILGSPRDLDGETFRPASYVSSDLDDGVYPPPVKERGVRNHQRGCFDVDVLRSKAGGLGLKRTPPGVATASSSDDSVLSTPLCSPDYFSLSPTDITPRSLIPLVSDLTPRDSTKADSFLMPSLSASLLEVSPSSISPASRSSLSSPSADDFVSTLTAALNASASPKTDYHQFLNKFCFYTGGTDSSCSSSSETNSPQEALSRSSSSSSIDEFLCATSPRLQGFAYGPHSSSSATGSGSVTPTSVTGSNGVERSRCPTPMAA